jgi:phosphoesterase RecJ-like protein
MTDHEVRERIRAEVDKASTFLITSAVKPDGDSVAAQLALRKLIETYRGAGARVDIVNEAACPRRYRFLAGSEAMRVFADGGLLAQYDMAFVVDCSPERTGAVRELFMRAPVKVTIDHHKVRSEGGEDISLVEPTASSTAEVIFGLVEEPAWRTPLTPELAEIIYTGVIFDTGGFQYKLTTPHTMRLGAKLLETGFDFAKAAERVLLTKSFASRKLMGRVLNNFRTNASGQVAYAVVSQRMMQETGADTDDLEGIVERLIFTEGVEVAVLAIDLAGSADYKLSLRSKGMVDVASLARGLDPLGGGHERAAGCNLTGEAEEILWRVIGAIEDALDLTENRTVARKGGTPNPAPLPQSGER